MRVAPEGWPFILGALALNAVFALLGWWILAAVWLPVVIWVVAFFRDPIRNGPRSDELILAPADGKVVGVVAMDEPTFLRVPAHRISIFLSLFSVHVNRYPGRGRLTYRQYTPGRFLNAMAEKASLVNEQSSIGLDTPRGRILVRQIAGLLARRIVTDHPADTEVGQGERLGLIRFGSRVDLFVPAGVEVLVREGDVVRTGLTVVARWV